MEPTTLRQDDSRVTMEAALTGMLALLVEEREARVKTDQNVEKIEILLANAGLSPDGIAAVTGKKRDTVRKTIERARAK